jgi:GDP-D-mannose dehydratase
MSSILITGATGKQGSSLIQNLLRKNAPYQVLAVTRNTQSPSAQKLTQKYPDIILVQGDLDHPAELFNKAQSLSSNPISSVFSVQVNNPRRIFLRIIILIIRILAAGNRKYFL